MKRLTVILVLIGSLLASLVLVGAASARQMKESAPLEVRVTVKEYTVEMSRTNLPANRPIKFSVINHGTVAHEVVLEKAGMVDDPLAINGEVAEIEDVAPNETKSAVWTIAEPGPYQLACHVPGHYEGGMVISFAINPTGLMGLIGQPTFWIVFAALLAIITIAVCVIILLRGRKSEVQDGAA